MENEVDIRVTNRSIPISEQEAPTEVRTDSDNLEPTFWINHQRQAIQHQEAWAYQGVHHTRGTPVV
jgi:hypothetical protein